jgi:cytochrome P450
VAGLAYPLPVMVIATMLGVQDGDLAAFKHWSDKIIDNIGPVLLRGEVGAIQGVNQEFTEYFTQRIAELRAAPEDNLLSELVHAETEDGQLGHEDLLMFCRLLLVAGNETTTGLIVSAARVLDAFPELAARLRDEPTRTATFVEEPLRFYSPFQMTIRRTLCDVEVAGVTIPRHRRVLMLLGSANRDPEQFTDADRFVVARDPNPHLAFGFGIHFCVGAHLARLEGQIAVQSLVRAAAGLRILDEQVAGLLRFGGPPSLRVRLEPRG